MNKRRANALCLFVAALWGGGFLATDAALNTFTPFNVLMIRFIGAALVSWFVCLIKKIHISKEAIIKGSVSGALLYLSFAFQTYGLALTNTGQNAFLTAVNVVLVPYIAWALWKRRPSVRQIFASFLCLIGIGCLSLSNGYFSLSVGDWCSLACAFFFACHILSLEYATKNCDSLSINAIQMSVSAIISIPFALCLETMPKSVSSGAVYSCLYMIFISTWFAFWLQTLAQKYTDSASASVLFCTESLFANIFGYFILHEEKPLIMVIGGLMIFVSVVLTEYSGQFRLSKR